MDRERSRWLIVLVAVPFLVGGGLAVLAALGAPPNAHVSLPVGVLNLAAGVGLLLRRPAWRTAALVLLALQLAGTTFLAALAVSGHSPLTLELFNHAILLGGGLDALLLVACVVVELGSLVILSRPSVRGAFAGRS